MTALALESINKSFGATHVLKDINLTVAEGEFIVFVGPSGCGKSTLLRTIAGLEDASSGRILIGGKDVTETPPAKRGIAMVFQSYALYPHLDVTGNMALGLKQAGESASVIADRIAIASKMLELAPYLHRRPSELSGGQRQRVAIGPRHREEARTVPVRRAAVEPRRRTPHGDAGGDRAAAPGAWGDAWSMSPMTRPRR